MRSHNSVKARILHSSSTNRIPALTKNEMLAKTCGNASSDICPLARTASKMSMALASENAISCTGVAPTSCKWYEHTFIGFHFGALLAHHAIMSTMMRRDDAGGKMYVPRDKYSLRMSFCVVPRNSFADVPCSAALATYNASNHAAVALIVIDVFI